MYETPGGTILHAAHRAIEQLTLDRGAAHLKDELMPRYAELIYNGFWFSPEREMLQAAIDHSQAKVEGTVRMKLYKGGGPCHRPQVAAEPLQRKGGDVRGRCRRLRPARRRGLHQAERAAAAAAGAARRALERLFGQVQRQPGDLFAPRIGARHRLGDGRVVALVEQPAAALLDGDEQGEAALVRSWRMNGRSSHTPFAPSSAKIAGSHSTGLPARSSSTMSSEMTGSLGDRGCARRAGQARPTALLEHVGRIEQRPAASRPGPHRTTTASLPPTSQELAPARLAAADRDSWTAKPGDRSRAPQSTR